MKKTCRVSAISCSGCAVTLQEKLGRVIGVKKVTVTLSKKEVTVEGFFLTFLLKRALKGTKFRLES